MCSGLCIYTYGMGVGPAWVCDGLSDVQTDVQNVPIDTVSDIHKLPILLMSHWDWCSMSAYNHFSAAPLHSVST